MSLTSSLGRTFTQGLMPAGMPRVTGSPLVGPSLRWSDGLICFLAGFALMLAHGARQLGAVLGGELTNPDGYMRLLRIEDGIRAGRIGFVIARDGSGLGTVLHWSHLLDSLLVAFAAPIAVFAGWHNALFWTGALSGPASVGLLGAALAWAVAPLADRAWLPAAPVLAAVAPATAAYGLPGVAHHHVLLAAAVVLAAGHAGRAARGDRWAGLRAGVAGAVAIWLSPETMPLVLAVFGLPALAWLTKPRAEIARALAACGAGFAGTLVLTWIADPPMVPFAAEIDRLSIVYVALGLASAAALALPCLGRRAVVLALGPLPILAWIAAFPSLLRGPEGIVDPASAHAFFDPILEMQPLATVAEASAMLLPCLLASIFVAARGIRLRSAAWLYAGAAGLAALGLGLWHVRFAIYGATFAAGALPVMLSRASRLTLTRWRPAARVCTVAGCVLLPVLPALAGARQGGHVAASCFHAADAGLLNTAAGHVVLASVNDVPELLYRTQVLTVGSLYHRNVAGFLRARAAWASDASSGVPDAFRVARIDYVLACPAIGTETPAGGASADSVAARLSRGEAVGWLTEIARAGAAGPVLFRVAE